MLAVLVPSPRGFPNDTIMGVFSLTEDTLGQCFYTKSFGKIKIISPKIVTLHGLNLTSLKVTLRGLKRLNPLYHNYQVLKCYLTEVQTLNEEIYQLKPLI